MKKSLRFILFLVLLSVVFFFFYFTPRNYEQKYQGADITEKYDKKAKLYYLTITLDGKIFSYVTKDKYTHQRKLVAKVETIKENNTFCIKPQSKKLALYPLCYQDNELVSFYALNSKLNDNVLENYEKINIYDFNNKNYLLWNYQNFIYLNKEMTEQFKINDTDLYNLKLVYSTNRYLLIPNQEDEFSFNKIWIIDAQKGKMKEYKLNKDIYFDSYYLGDYKNKVYLVDRKNSQEYEINLKNGKLAKTSGKILKNNKWKKISISKLIHNEYQFENNTFITYSLEDNFLYALVGDTKIKLVNREISTIIKANDYDVYYISEDSLYYFNFFTGEKKIFSYNEWNFNYQNMIYVFD